MLNTETLVLRLRHAAVFLMAFVAISAHAILAVPPSGHRVTDLTGTLSPTDTELVARDLERIEKETQAQVLVLVVESLQDEPIEDFSVRVFDEWKPGHAGVNDGVIIVLAKKERRMRIAVGRGLEGAIPDLAAKRVTAGKMVPAFKRGAFAAGFIDAANELERLIKVEQKLTVAAAASAPVAAAAPREEDSGIPMFVIVFGVVGLGVVIWIGFLDAIVSRPSPRPARSDTERSRTEYERASPNRRSNAEIFSSEPRPRRRTYSTESSTSMAAGAVLGSTWSSGSSPSPDSSNTVSSGGGDTAGGGASDSY
jgi:uncharacterized membrane protein YgcG